MKRKGLRKKLSAALLAATVAVSAFPQLSTPVHAQEKTNELPTRQQFITKTDLLAFDTDVADPYSSEAKVYFGTNPEEQTEQQWWIAGWSSTYSIVLIAANPLQSGVKFNNNVENKKYENKDVYPNHYGASDIRQLLDGIEKDEKYFSSVEQSMMNHTEIATYDDHNKEIYKISDVLYLPYAEEGTDYITVGRNQYSDNLNKALRVDNTFFPKTDFWVRTPASNSTDVLTANLGQNVTYKTVTNDLALLPAFELDISKVAFASKIPVVSNQGKLNESDAFTLRYESNDLDSSMLSFHKHEIQLTNVPENTYLVIQNKDGAYSKAVSGSNKLIPSDIDNALTSFEDCMVWLETTDKNTGAVYAYLAKEQDPPIAEVNGVQYTSLGQAVANCSPGGEIKILYDFMIVKWGEVKFTKDCILNLNGNIITVATIYGMEVAKDASLKVICGEGGDIVGRGISYAIANDGNINVIGQLSCQMYNSGNIIDGVFKGFISNHGIIENGKFYAISSINDAMIKGGYFKEKPRNEHLASGVICIDTNNSEFPYKVVNKENICQLEIALANGLTFESGKLQQVVEKNIEIQPITIKVNEGYYLPEDYINNLQSKLNGLTVTETDTGFTISGTLTSNVNITLPAVTQKVYGMTLSENGTFTAVCVGYEPITAKEITITNTGNVDLENVNVSVTGKDVDKFELSWDNTTTIQPNGTITVTVKPANDLAVSTYQATLSVSADHVNAVTTDLQFTVNEHDYNAVVTPPTCTEKGYTTYTCKNCPHSYVGNETAANGHTFGEWENIDAPTCEQGGSRKHTCIDCGYSETENLNPNGHAWEDEYTVDKEATCTQDGSKSIHCKNCNAVKDSTTIAKSGHSFVNYVSDGNATCTKDSTKTAKCDRCDETDTIVDVGTMLEHEYEWGFNHDATCEKNGTETGICKHCQTTVTREKADTAFGHEFKNYVSDDNATCTENGTESAKCERCDKTDTRVQENSVLGHKLGEWKVIQNATTTETGTRERYCERCDYTETEVIPMISEPTQPNDKPNTGEPNTGKPNTDEPNTGKPNTDEPNTDTPNTDKANADTPNNDKVSVKTGDQTNVCLFASLFIMSTLCILFFVVRKKKRTL